MLNRSFCSLLLTAVLLWPIQATETISVLSFLRKPLRVEAAAEVAYLEELSTRGVDMWDQGVRVESLDGSMIYADHLSDRGL